MFQTDKIKVISPSLPKGGQTITGMGEQFAPHEFSGAASLNIPFPITPCRGIEPSLQISYSSGNSNSSFGFGWELSLSSISRQTSKGVPKYNDSDTFLLAGDDYLVKKTNTLIANVTIGSNQYEVQRYIPRVEGNYSLIDYYINKADASDQFWKITSSSNVNYIFGKSKSAQIYNPSDQNKIFKWQLEEVYDDKGNHRIYNYTKENNENLTDVQLKSGRNYTTNNYLSKITYGNPTSITDGSIVLGESKTELADLDKWQFELILDYGQYNVEISNLTPYTIPEGNSWSVREDSYSSYDAGFEIRTWRLCRNVLMFHRFEELQNRLPVLTNLLSLTYKESSFLTSLVAAQSTGSRVNKAGNAYEHKSMPAVEMDYTPFYRLSKNDQSHNWQPLDASTWDYHYVDLHSIGIPGLLKADGETVFYREPTNLSEDGKEVLYSADQSIDFPIGKVASNLTHQLADVTGNGLLDLVVTAPSRNGFYEMDEDGKWQNFQSFNSFPLDYHNPLNVQIDLTGNGLSDLALIESKKIRYNPSIKSEGYTKAILVDKENNIPSAGSSPKNILNTFADFLGAGTAQQVQIKNNSVVCWPGLGYGQFGAAVTLTNAPDFGEDFDVGRLHLVDIDGSGVTDLAYVYPDKVEFYLNQSGNSFAGTPITIAFPTGYLWTPIDKIEFADVLGNGTSCMVFTKMTPKPSKWLYNFNLPDNKEDLVQKPHLLQSIKNNLGATTIIVYRSSVWYYLNDKKNGNPWATHLPFPVNVIASTTHEDEISGTSFTSSYAYSHGYYDGLEREFRGFGFVARTDSHSFDELILNTQTANDAAYSQASMLTKTWYHTGASLQETDLLKTYQSEYWHGDKQAYDMPSTAFSFLTNDQNSFSEHGAHRALHGTVLRSEVYGNDHSPWSEIPYTVHENQFNVIEIQAKQTNKYAVFQLHEQQSIQYDYERNVTDPMVSHSFSLKVDAFGQVLESASVAYGRRGFDNKNGQTANQQGKLWVTYISHDLLNSGEVNGTYLLGIPVQNKQFEIKNLSPDTTLYFSFEELQTKIKAALTNSSDHQLLHWERDYYFDAINQKELVLNAIQIPVLHHRTEQVFFDEKLLKSQLLEIPFANMLLGGQTSDNGVNGGYITFDSQTDEAASLYYWNPGASQRYSNSSDFYLPSSYFDPFQYLAIYHGSKKENLTDIPNTSYTYDPYKFMVASVTDGLGNQSIMSDFDYVQMHAKTMTDPNDNWSKIVTDPMGKVLVTAHGGEQGNEKVNFDVDQYKEIINPSVKDILQNPEKYLQKTATFFHYDLDSWKDKGIPVHSVHLNYTEYTNINGKSPDNQQVHKSITYSDGFGRTLQSKAWLNTPQEIRYLSNGQVSTKTVDECWLTSGAIIYNDKGNPIKQYEPFYGDSYEYVNNESLNQVGYAAALFYDALGREVLTKSADGYFTKTLYGELSTHTSPLTYNGYLNQKLYDQLGNEDFDENGISVSSPKSLSFQPAPWNSLHYDANDCINMHEAIINVHSDVNTDSFTKALAFANTPHQSTIGSNGKVIETRQLNVQETEQNINYTTYDVFGNPLTRTDQRLFKNGVSNFETTYNMGIPVKVISTDAGTSWNLSDVVGHPIYHKDSRGFEQFTTYDELLRPLAVVVKGGTIENPETDESTPLNLNNTVRKMVYCDTKGAIDFSHAQQANLIGKTTISFDESGLQIAPIYSITGVPMCGRQLIRNEYKKEADWSGVTLDLQKHLVKKLDGIWTREALEKLDLPTEKETDSFVTSATHNAIGQVLTAIDSDGNAQNPIYDSLGREISLNITAGKYAKESGSKTTPSTSSIAYNAKGQHITEITSNGVLTSHSYDAYNFRLTSIKSTRNSDSKVLQDLVYHHDPVGNVCTVTNNAIPTVFFANQQVDAKADYTFDSLYQLIKATGREQAGLNSNNQNNQGKGDNTFYQQYVGQQNNTKALQNYSRTYSYDGGGNLLTQKQINGIARVTTVSSNNNRIVTSGTGNNIPKSYQYDAHGNMLTLSGSAGVTWNYRDNMASATQITRQGGIDDTEYYVYDGSGKRVRKISEQLGSNGSINISETLYAGGIEIRRCGTKTSADAETINYTKIWHNVKLMQGRAVGCLWRYWVKGDLKEGAVKSQQRFQLTDKLDSSNYEVDENGKLITYEEYYPYGGTSIITATSATEVKNKYYRYSSQEKDRTGLYYYGMRYYAPWLGRWTCTDPAGTVDGLNIYAFVNGNPVSSVDIGGMEGSGLGFINNENKLNEKATAFRRTEHPGNEIIDTKYAKISLSPAIQEHKKIPLISSYNSTFKKHSYTDIFNELRKEVNPANGNPFTDSEIAKDLLNRNKEDEPTIFTGSRKDAAAVFTGIVEISEEVRSKSASNIADKALEKVQTKKYKLGSKKFLEDFPFAKVGGAMEGRKFKNAQVNELTSGKMLVAVQIKIERYEKFLAAKKNKDKKEVEGKLEYEYKKHKALSDNIELIASDDEEQSHLKFPDTDNRIKKGGLNTQNLKKVREINKRGELFLNR